MKTCLSFKGLFSHDGAEKEVARLTGKLQKLLKNYEPDLVQFHGAFEKQPRRIEYKLSLTLSLPTGTLHATCAAPGVRASAKQAFEDLERQVKKLQGKLRHDYEWKRKRSHDFATAP